MDDAIGWIVGITIVGIIAFMVSSLMKAEDPCRQQNVEFRQELIEAHERCMIEENCIYKDWNIRRYDTRLEAQARCESQ